MNFQCDNCGKTFKRNENLKYHLNKKNKCIKIIDSKLLEKYLKDNKCVYCEKVFKQKCSVMYHIKNNCKKVKQLEEEKHEIFQKLKNEEDNKMKQLENKIEKLESYILELELKSILSSYSTLRPKDGVVIISAAKIEKLKREIDRSNIRQEKILNLNIIIQKDSFSTRQIAL